MAPLRQCVTHGCKNKTEKKTNKYCEKCVHRKYEQKKQLSVKCSGCNHKIMLTAMYCASCGQRVASQHSNHPTSSGMVGFQKTSDAAQSTSREKGKGDKNDEMIQYENSEYMDGYGKKKEPEKKSKQNVSDIQSTPDVSTRNTVHPSSGDSECGDFATSNNDPRPRTSTVTSHTKDPQKESPKHTDQKNEDTTNALLPDEHAPEGSQVGGGDNSTHTVGYQLRSRVHVSNDCPLFKQGDEKSPKNYTEKECEKMQMHHPGGSSVDKVQKMAASNIHQFVEHLDEQVLECPLCYKRLQDPKTLPCLHTYCFPCLTEWVNKKGELVCPNCIQSFPIPDGGLQKLPPNTFINNLLESIEQLENADNVKCYCGKNTADFYCQECIEYICTTCKHTHEKLKILKEHKLLPIEHVKAMTPLQFAALRSPLCSAHKKNLEFYCNFCKVPVCMHCTITDHKEWGGKHEPIHISEAFKLFKQTSTDLKKDVDACKQTIQAAITEVHHKTTKLEQCRETCRKDINSYVEEMIQMITEKGVELNKKVDELYMEKKKITDTQTDELNTIMSNVDKKWNFIAQLLKSSEATALQSSHNVITVLQETIQQLPDTKPKDNGEMYVNLNKECSTNTFKQWGLGFVTETHLEMVNVPTLLTQGQMFEAEIVQHSSTEIDNNFLKATLISPGEETELETVKHDEGKHVVKTKCRSAGVWKLDVSVGDEPIRGSPLMITVVEKEGLVNTIETKGMCPCDVLMSDDGCLLVSCFSNVIHRYKQSGEYVSKITLPSNVKVFKMYKIKNKDLIVFTDYANKCITLCKSDGYVIKSVGKGVLKDPYGIHVDEKLSVVYVADFAEHCVFMLSMDSDHVIRTRIGSKGESEGELFGPWDVTVTNEGYLIIADNANHRLQLFDNEGKFMNVLVSKGDQDGKVINPRAVIIDNDNNMLVMSKHKLQLFNSDGHFIKRIDQEDDGLNAPGGLSIISYNPRRVAVANHGGKNIKVFNY